MNDYKIVNGIYFKKDTNDDVCNILAKYCGDKKQRVRVFYGNTDTGKDWLEVYNTIGYIGKSCGNIKIPLMLSKRDSAGGSPILDDYIVKITINKKVVYKHPLYNCPIDIRVNEIWDFEEEKRIFVGKSEMATIKEYDFFKGLRNRHNYK